MTFPVSSAPRKTLRDQQKESTRALLLLAARQSCAESGWMAATVEQIAAGAGTSRATFYLHFASKADLAKAVIADVHSRAPDILGSEGTNGLDDAALLPAVRAMVAFYREEIDAFRLWHEASLQEPTLEDPINATRSLFVTRLVGGSRWTSKAAAQRADLLVAMMVLPLDRLLYAWLISGWPLREADVVREIVALWQAYYLPELRALRA